MELVDKITLLKEELELENEVLKKNIKIKEKENNFIVEENKELRNKLDKILYSRSYKFLQKCKKLIKRG